MTKLMDLSPPPKCGEFFTVGDNAEDRFLVYIDPIQANSVIAPLSGLSFGIAYFENPIRVRKEWAKTHIEQLIEVKKIKRERIKKKLATCQRDDRCYLQNEINVLSFHIRNLNYFYDRHVCEKYQSDICLSGLKTKCGQWYKVYHKGGFRHQLILIDAKNSHQARITHWPEPFDTNIFFGPVLLTKDQARLQLLKDLESKSDEIEGTPERSRSPLESVKESMLEFYKTHFGELGLDS